MGTSFRLKRKKTDSAGIPKLLMTMVMVLCGENGRIGGMGRELECIPLGNGGIESGRVRAGDDGNKLFIINELDGH